MKFLRILLLTQGIYTLLTALWPIVHIKSFMDVTGPKTDIWLVKTVGALLIPISLTMFFFVIVRMDNRPVALLAGTTSLAFIVIDLVYALQDVIPDIYLADAVVEMIFLLGWLCLISFRWNEIKHGHA
jgi:hypothetical protein